MHNCNSSCGRGYFSICLAALSLCLGTGRLGAVGNFIPATNRVDIVHDAGRDVLYITSGGQVLRYHLGSAGFLTPFELGGNLCGIDLSPDGNTLAVADRARSATNVWIHLVDLPSGTASRVFFPRAFGEGGTFMVAFGGDGALLVTSTYEGSGSAPMRRYDPADGTTRVISSVSQSTMVSASGDGSVIGYAGPNNSGGPFGWYDVGDQTISQSAGTGWFNFEIGVSRDGSQFAVPTYGGTFVYNATLNRLATIGVYAGGQPICATYHPAADVVFFPWATTREIRAYDTVTLQQIGSFDFEHTFSHTGNWALGQGRLRISRDGATLFCTVNGGVRYYRHTLNVPVYWRLGIAGDPRRIGTPTPTPYGTNWLPRGRVVTNQVTSTAELDGVRYVCTGWSGTGSVPSNGTSTTVVFTLNDNSTLTWHWTPVAYQLSVTVAGSGSVNNTGAWYNAGQTATLLATPASNFRFVRWVGDVPLADSTNNPIELVMDQGRRLTALFAPQGSSEGYLPGDWPTYGRSASHAGYFQGVLGNAHFSNRWTVGAGAYEQVAVAQGRVFVSRLTPELSLDALDAASGIVMWRYPFPAGHSLNPPTYYQGSVYVQRGNHGSDSQLFSIDAATGRLNWSAPFGAQWEGYMAPTVVDEGVFVNAGYYGGIYGFNRSTGAQLFFLGLEQYDEWTPTFHNGRLYSWVEGKFREHNPQTGAIRRTLDLEWDWSGWSMGRTTAAADGRAYMVGNPDLFAVELETHQLVWKVEGRFFGTPAVANGIVYAISNNAVVAFAAHDGQYVGSYTASEGLGPPLIVTDDILLVASGNQTFVFDLGTFAVRQTLPVGGQFSLTDGALYIAEGGRLHAYSTGQDVTLVIAGDPVAVGMMGPNAYGTNYLPRGHVVTNSVRSLVETNRARYQSLGWSGTGSVPATGTGNRVVFTLTTNSTLIWRWQPLAYLLSAGVAGRGSINFSNGWIDAGTSVMLTATPQTGYRFLRWAGDVSAASETSNPVALTMDRPRRVTAIFGSDIGVPLEGGWPTFGNGPAHSGYLPGVLGNASFRLRWAQTIGGTLQQAAVGGDHVFVTPYQYFDNAFMGAYHVYSGQQIWYRAFPRAFSINPPTYHDGAVFMQRGNHSDDTHLWSFDAITGQTNWQTGHAAQWERYMAPTVADGMVWVNGGSYGGMYGFSRSNGVQRFFVNLDQYDDWTPTYHDQKLYSFVASKFREHNPLSGEINWTLNFGVDYVYGDTATVVADGGYGYVYTTGSYGTNGAGLVAVDLTARRISWRVPGFFRGFPAAANGIVYAISNAVVMAYSEQDGQLIGSFVADETLALQQPIVTADTLFVSSETTTYVFDLATFARRQTLPVAGRLSLANGVLYVAGEGELRAYSSTTDLPLLVRSNSGLYGEPTPATYGTNLVPSGVALTTGVTTPWPGPTGVRYVNLGWLGTGSVPANGASNAVTFTLSAASSLTWLWKTQYFLNVVVVSNGTVSLDDGWYDAGTVLSLTATSSNYFHFANWGGSISGTSPTTSVPMNGPRTVVAYFVEDLAINGVPKWWLAQFGISPDDAGALADADGDSLPNWREYAVGSHPLNSDTDGDGYSDGLEVAWNSSPTSDLSVPKAQLVIEGSPARYASPAPLPYGTNLVPLFQVVSNYVPPTSFFGGVSSQRYRSLGWTGLGSAPASGTNNVVIFSIQTNSSITWNWATQYLVQVVGTSNGSVSVAREITPGNFEMRPDGWWDGGTTLKFTATPSNYFRFMYWTGDINTGTNSFSWVLQSPVYITAIFAPRLVTNNVPEWWLAAHGLPVSDAGALGDTDSDGLANWQEFAANTNPNLRDTDGDTYDDGIEVSRGSDPTLASSIPRVVLTITSQPPSVGQPSPLGYGTHQLPLFGGVSNSVPPIVDGGPGSRFLSTGWGGTGNVPATGTLNQVSFAISNNSSLTWHWQRQFALSIATNFDASADDRVREQAKLFAPDARADDLFGWRVAVHGERMIVGAPFSAGNPTNFFPGAAYIFLRTANGWVQEAKFAPTDYYSTTYFGCAVAIYRDTAVALSLNGPYSGTLAHLYRRTTNGWVPDGRLTTPGAVESWERAAVALGSNVLAVAASGDSSSLAQGGSVYYYRKAGQWNPGGVLRPSDYKAQQFFGSSLAIADDLLVVGAYGDFVGRSVVGSAYVFRSTGNSYFQETRLIASNAVPFADFGSAVAIQNGVALVGARYDETNGIPSGTVYAFRRNAPNVWVQEARLAPPNPTPYQAFGDSLAFLDNTALIGSPQGDGAVRGSGVASLFQRSGSNWTSIATLTGSTAGVGDLFANSVALGSNFAVVASPNDATRGRSAGAVYPYDSNGFPAGGNLQWYVAGESAGTPTAPASLTLSNVTYRFVGWLLDGVRQTNSNGTLINPLSGIAMQAPHSAVAFYIPDNSDGDADGLSDWWEYYHFGHYNASALSDNDGDGHSNAHEWEAGTNPNDRSSVLRMNGWVAAANYRVSWPSTAGRTYRLLSSTNVAGPFAPVANGIAATPPVNTYEPAVGSATQRFYRIEVE